MKQWVKKHSRLSILLVVLLISICTHFAYYSRQKESVFDEVYFGTFAQNYYKHTYYFDIHPPLGKLLIAASALPKGIPTDAKFQNEAYQGTQPNFARLRLLPTLAGTLLPVVITLLAFELRFSRKASLLTGLFIALENALIVQSKIILLDNFFLLFGFLGLLFFVKYYRYRNLKWLLLTGIFAGLAGCIKWTALVFLGFIGIMYLYMHFRERKLKAKLVKLTQGFVFLLAIPFAIYFASFAVHFALLTKTGDGDAFMSTAFQHSLKGSLYETDNLKSPSLVSKFAELNKTMYTANKTVGGHPYASKWYTWPIMKRSVYYYLNGNQKIYLIGNPITWWASTVAVLSMTVFVIVDKKYRNKINVFLLVGFLLSWLPFILISRIMFLYHYFVPLIFALLILARLIDSFTANKKVFMAAAGICLLSFLYFAPLTYGLPLTESQFNHHMWFKTWI